MSGYASQINWSKSGKLDLSCQEWFLGWESIGIDMKTIKDSQYYWWDFEVIKYFNDYGYLRFWFDDIWNFDWEKFRHYVQIAEPQINCPSKVIPPPRLFLVFLKLLIQIIEKAKLLARKIFFL